MSKVKLRPITMMLLAALVIGNGCNSDDSRVAEVAVEAAKRQAQQNQEMAHLNREVAEGTKRLVEGQAEADQRFQSMQQDLHAQRDQLETERRQQAETRQRDSLLAPVLTTLGVLLVCSLPLIVCWKLLTGLGNESAEATIAQLLIDDVIGPNGTASSVGEEWAALQAPQAPVTGIESPPPRPGSDPH